MNVEIMGTVLYANQKSTSIVYTIDDGEDIIQCIVWIPDEFRMRQNTSNVPGLEFIEIGNVVRVMGELNNYMGAIQIVAQPGTIICCKDPNAETIFRLQVLNLERFFYSKPVVLPEFVLNEVEKKSKPGPTTASLLENVRSWVNGQTSATFIYSDLEQSMLEMAYEIVCQKNPGMHPLHKTSRATNLVTKCIQRLLTEGVVEMVDRDSMLFKRVDGSSSDTLPGGRSAGSDELYLSSGDWIRKVIEIDDDTGDDSDLEMVAS